MSRPIKREVRDGYLVFPPGTSEEAADKAVAHYNAGEERRSKKRPGLDRQMKNPRKER